MTQAAAPEGLADRITNYLPSGGLFNPEMMEHDKVRDLLIDCREALAAIRERPADDPVWCTMDSAPKDGTTILASHEHAMFTVTWHADGRTTETSRPGWVDGSTNFDGELQTFLPTKWRHLPPGPDATQQREQATASQEQLLADEILAELVRARTKFPGKNVTFAALVEEVGELATATFEESNAAVRKEAVQVAVMAMRMVLDGDHTFDAWRESKGLDALAASRSEGDE